MFRIIFLLLWRISFYINVRRRDPPNLLKKESFMSCPSYDAAHEWKTGRGDFLAAGISPPPFFSCHAGIPT